VSDTAKTFSPLRAEAGYLDSLTEQVRKLDKERLQIAADSMVVVSQARERLGLPTDARLIYDSARRLFVLEERAAAPAPPAPPPTSSTTPTEPKESA